MTDVDLLTPEGGIIETRWVKWDYHLTLLSFQLEEKNKDRVRVRGTLFWVDNEVGDQ